MFLGCLKNFSESVLLTLSSKLLYLLLFVFFKNILSNKAMLCVLSCLGGREFIHVNILNMMLFLNL